MEHESRQRYRSRATAHRSFSVSRLHVARCQADEGLVEGYFFNNMTPNFMGLFYVTVTPNIMGLSYVLSYRGLSYVPETPNIMDLSYVE